MGGAISRTPLASTDQSASSIQLYDRHAMLHMKREVAQGYIILLSGGLRQSKPSNRRRSKREKAGGQSSSEGEDDAGLQLAFASLLDGNVIDSCFGVSSQQRNNSDSELVKNSRKAKHEIAAASDTSDAVQSIAVKSYEQGFQAVMDYRDEMDQLNLCSRCIWSGEIRRDAEASLRQAFEPLDEALAAATN